MKRNRKVKILATLGPASSEEEMIQKLHEAGADLFRINMSHASHDMMRTLIKRIRNVEQRCGRPDQMLGFQERTHTAQGCNRHSPCVGMRP